MWSTQVHSTVARRSRRSTTRALALNTREDTPPTDRPTERPSIIQPGHMSVVKYAPLLVSSTRVSGYHFHFRSSSAVIFGLCEVADGQCCCSHSLTGCRLACTGHFELPAACDLYAISQTDWGSSQPGSTSISFTYCITQLLSNTRVLDKYVV